jgi:uncharacterized protein YlzI (FlbEa/FlbD family)
MVSLKGYEIDNSYNVNPIFGPDKPPFFDKIQNNEVLRSNEEIINKISEFNEKINDLTLKPSTKETAQRIKFFSKKVEELQAKYVEISSPESPILEGSESGQSTPIAYRSPPVNTTNLDLPDITDTYE